MMYMKARIMKDDETAARIREATDAREAKRLGREVQNFNQKVGTTIILNSRRTSRVS